MNTVESHYNERQETGGITSLKRNFVIKEFQITWHCPYINLFEGLEKCSLKQDFRYNGIR